MVSLTRGTVNVGASMGNGRCTVPSVGNTGPVVLLIRISQRIKVHSRIAINEGTSEDLELLVKASDGATTTSQEMESSGFSLQGSLLPDTDRGQIGKNQAKESTKANTKVDRIRRWSLQFPTNMLLKDPRQSCLPIRRLHGSWLLHRLCRRQV